MIQAALKAQTNIKCLQICKLYVLIVYLIISHPQYKLLFTFDTEFNKTKVVDKNPAFVWGKKLPQYKPNCNH